jgi:protein involved in sex pheromone biosynthesis
MVYSFSPVKDKTKLYLALLASTLIMIGCTSSTDQMVQRVVSNDGEFSATVSVNQGSALEHNWYGVSVGKVHPSWSDSVLRRTAEGICSLQGPGSVTVSWTGPREVTVNCDRCQREDFYVFKHEWEGIFIKYHQILGPELTGPEVKDTIKR